MVDEFGGTAGIVTMEDVLEEIFGEIEDEYDEQELIEKKLSDTEYIFSGRLELDYLYEKYGIDFSADSSETLSGYLIHHHESIPNVRTVNENVPELLADLVYLATAPNPDDRPRDAEELLGKLRGIQARP